MSFKDLPKSLIDAATEVVETSAKNDDALALSIIKEGLKRFGLKNQSSLTEEQEKILYSWCKKEFDARKLEEQSCHCDDMMSEDDMPGDEVFHVDGDEDAEKKKELGENEDVMVAETITYQVFVGGKLESSHSTENDAKNRVKNLNWFWKNRTKEPFAPELKSQKPKIEIKQKKSLNENVAIAPHELATNGAVGVSDADAQMPVHVDVLKDSNPVDGSHEYRLFVQFNTNGMPSIVPPVTLPGAPTVESLRDIVEGLPYYGEAVEKALSEASDIPHERPEHKGS